MKIWIESIIDFLNSSPVVKQSFFIILTILSSSAAYQVTKRVVLKWLIKLAKKTENKFDDILLDKKVARRLAFIPAILIINGFAYLFPTARVLLQRVSLALIGWIVLLTIAAFLRAVNQVYKQDKKFAGRPIKGYVQIIILIIYILGGLITIGILSGQSPFVLLSGVGALTAVLLLVFRDTLLSFVASIQITTNDLVRLGDWIEVSKFNADGDVIDIALHTVKIRNFDKTVTVIPTNKLIEASFKNWRGMTESGGRRIKRCIHIDIDSIKFCENTMIEKFEKIVLLKDYMAEKKQEIRQYNEEHKFDMNNMVNGRRLTNLGTFRTYIEAYLRSHKKIKQDFTFLVRQLQPGPHGLPIEIYVFTDDTVWVNYEAIQADIFDHLLAVVKEFDLRVYQIP
ncbi:MAG: mechanosensitive ion channel family protein [Candidatus Aminicenantes bacterium]|nr:mechanosensitive ion channel family protein [Candidatus Aminicenantes bacterium]